MAHVLREGLGASGTEEESTDCGQFQQERTAPHPHVLLYKPDPTLRPGLPGCQAVDPGWKEPAGTCVEGNPEEATMGPPREWCLQNIWPRLKPQNL